MHQGTKGFTPTHPTRPRTRLKKPSIGLRTLVLRPLPLDAVIAAAPAAAPAAAASGAASDRLRAAAASTWLASPGLEERSSAVLVAAAAAAATAATAAGHLQRQDKLPRQPLGLDGCRCHTGSSKELHSGTSVSKQQLSASAGEGEGTFLLLPLCLGWLLGLGC